jgi:hypothetical protein
MLFLCFAVATNREKRFFEEVKAYNEKLVAWSRDSKVAIEGLVAGRTSRGGLE